MRRWSNGYDCGLPSRLSGFETAFLHKAKTWENAVNFSSVVHLGFCFAKSKKLAKVPADAFQLPTMISIIIPALNEEHYIGNLLNDYLNQTFKNFEVIVVDGNSADKTQKIVKDFSKKNKKIKLIVSEKRNVSYQRNLGVKNAKFGRLLFNDADISIENDFLGKAVRELTKRDLKVSGCYLIPNTKNLIDKLGHYLLNKWFFLMQYIYPHMVGQAIFSTKEIHNKINGFDQTIRFAEDNDYVNRSKKYYKFRILKYPRIYTSTRRFKEENRLILALKYLLCPFYRMFFGEIQTDIFNYKMDKGKNIYKKY